MSAGRDFLVREWKEKAEEYRVERDAAEAQVEAMREALEYIVGLRSSVAQHITVQALFGAAQRAAEAALATQPTEER